MNKEVFSIKEKMAELRLIPVYTPKKAVETAAVCRALCDAGLPAIEVTMRTAEAAEAISLAAKAKADGVLPEDFLILAGTVLNVQAAETAAAAGATAIVSPGFDEDVVSFCAERGIPCFPGVATASELTRAVAAGLDVVKFFPAEAAGGTKTLAALSAPFPGVRFMPTGGITQSNLRDYLALPSVICCGGSFMFPKGPVDPDEIAARTRRALKSLDGDSEPFKISRSDGGPVAGFGEIMIRLSSPEPGVRLRDASSFSVCCGGSEANSLGLLASFGEKTELLSALPDGPLGDLPAGALRAAGVGTSRIIRKPGRCGLYFLEKGIDLMPSEVIYDRKGSAFASVKSAEWQAALPEGISWLHLSGITPALSPDAREAAEKLIGGAQAAGIPVSLDVNYRANLWTREEAAACLRKLASGLYLCVINEEAASILGVECPYIADRREKTARLCRLVSEKYGIAYVAATVRTTLTQERGRLSAVLYSADSGKTAATPDREFSVKDRVGSGDCFTGGLIYALRHSFDPDRAAGFALACAVLKHYTAGDMPSITLSEALSLAGAPYERDGGVLIKR